ncbi:stage II sporulation protein p [Bacillus sp. OxB-1]|uniref:stage II sporulation protein P n=1 Tax=Bacillus sp. (strain OxB-1) TaxID=98228 RepID=UPI000582188C|nr:stage II sporulation protein P [Bacillus sp. OxB-1]BAQ11502.1 stage II sporulation protein p [Bacillus sp. OxB-1]
MKNPLHIWGTLILILFLFPVVIQFVPGGPTVKSSNLAKESTYIVYASNVVEEEPAPEVKEATGGDSKVLLYFTHSHEAFEPITKAVAGKVAVSHQTENIVKVGGKLQNQLQFHGIPTDVLPVDNAKEMSSKGIPHSRAYAAIRPHVKQRLGEKEYELIIDLHRDSVGPAKTTMTHEGERFAKVAFVIGTEHPKYKENQAKANRLKQEMEKLVPGITRSFIMKGGAGVDGKYNQDLDPSIMLLELGGIGNTEDELNRTVSVIAQAASTMLSEESPSYAEY